MLAESALLSAETSPIRSEQHGARTGRAFIDDQELLGHFILVTPAKAGVQAALVARRPHGFQLSLE
jgi:hypothetical protein